MEKLKRILPKLNSSHHLKLPSELKERLKKRAQKNYVSLNSFILACIISAISKPQLIMKYE